MEEGFEADLTDGKIYMQFLHPIFLIMIRRLFPLKTLFYFGGFAVLAY